MPDQDGEKHTRRDAENSVRPGIEGGEISSLTAS